MRLQDDPLSLMPDLEHATTLSFSDVAGQLSPALLHALLSQPHGAPIDLLDLSEQHLNAAVIDLLAQSAQLLTHLKWLDLSFNPVGVEGLARLLTAPFEALEAARLEHASMWRGECHLISELSIKTKNLKHLDLAANHLTDQGLEQLTTWPVLTQLLALGLRDNSLTDASIDALIASPSLAQGDLRALDLGHNRLSDEALSRLLRSPSFASITHLFLDHTSPRRATLDVLAAHSPHLTTLSLNETRCGTIALKHFARVAPKGALHALQKLDLNGCALKDAGVRGLLEREDLDAIETLDLSRNALGDRGLSGLAQSALSRSLRHLKLDGNPALTLGAILPLLDQGAMPSLATLSINDTGLGAEERSLVEHITREQGQRLHTWQRA